ncbi:MAG: cyclic lactone autoinducer peptide [Bacillota bacterium]|nr:cyclic lactone autoinducer peptide [Bacillota bacterium]
MKKLIGIAIMAMLTTLVASGVASACWLFGYQPEVPKSLIK